MNKIMEEEAPKKVSKVVIDAGTGQVLGGEQSYEAQRAAGRFVDAVTEQGREDEALRVLGDQLREERQRLAVAAGKQDVQSMEARRTSQVPKKKEGLLSGLLKKK